MRTVSIFHFFNEEQKAQQNIIVCNKVSKQLFKIQINNEFPSQKTLSLIAFFQKNVNRNMFYQKK